MRAVFGVLAVGLFMCIGASSYAGTSFPDLPGMGSAAKATHNQSPTTSRSENAPVTSSSNTSPTSGVSSAAKSSIKPDKIATILKMPGAGAIPVLKDLAKTSQRTKTALPDMLFVLAGIGTATSLGMLWAVRRRFDRA